MSTATSRNLSTVAYPGREAVAKAVSRLWWLLLVRGIVLVLLGLYALWRPGMTLAAFTQVLGAFAVVDGVLALVFGILGRTESRGWSVLRGVLGILVGLFVFVHPVLVGAIAALTVVFVLAFQAIVGGILEIAGAIRHRKQIEGEGWLIVGGVLSVAFGMLLLAAPLLASLILIRFVGAFALFFGIALIVNAFYARKLGKVIEGQ